MLVLTRRATERILIGDAICSTVVAIQGGRVRLGITAPASVPVDRWEVRERVDLRVATLSVSLTLEGEDSMRTAQLGDRVQVHYVKRLQDGSMSSSRGRVPLEVTVGTDDPRLPGLGLALVGMPPGASTTVSVPSEQAYGPADATRVRRWARTRFPSDQALPVGKWVRALNSQGRRRLVRILEVRGKTVVVDTNHRWAGLALELEVELIEIRPAPTGTAPQGS